ncbi:hypothetical protein CHREV_025 [Choristoneura rosaceana entomopoxvirus 'L']|uniref:Uncharacterized protein n=1 Tax=Choristoneura rosaceana entomopoxvirus 'L' TaxID=1293539 RepID=A0ABM9QK62_9POXV|nr:hypothetical protein CHREV_025 [Choristoneura rosaceana entomopoxvirus 'L']CCU55927.1 hypothetical protein CHREV_025 [Choristoneura rosaceana entomopoxvirus 'L']
MDSPVFSYKLSLVEMHDIMNEIFIELDNYYNIKDYEPFVCICKFKPKYCDCGKHIIYMMCDYCNYKF